MFSRNLFTNLQYVYRIPTAKKFFAHPIKIAIFRVDMGVNVEYNVGNLLDAQKLRK